MRVAVLGAGGPAGVNTLRALHQAGHDLIAVDSDRSHLVFCEQYAEIREHDWSDVDVVIPQPDTLVPVLAGMELRPKTLLPTVSVIERCQDKLEASLRWYWAKLRELPPWEIVEPWPDTLHLAADSLGLPLWLRATKGAGAKGAIKVTSLDQAYHWIRFWQSRSQEFGWMAEEFLPGRDFAWSSIWYEGELITSFARERLEYLYPHLTPEGLTGTPTAARIVCDEVVNASAEASVRAIDPVPHGIYSVDLREDREGHPRPTEINAGRGFTTFGLWSLYSYNFMDLVVRLARDGRSWWLHRPDLSEPPKYNALPSGMTLYRHIDCGHTFVHARELAPAA